MTRTEENSVLLEKLKEVATAENTTGTYAEVTEIHLKVIAVALADISKSLAVIADK